jgi:hypothetical protein
LIDRLVVFVNEPGTDISDGDWQRYVDWLKALQSVSPELKILTAPGGRAPSSAQRSVLNRELKTDSMRVAVMLSDWKLVAVVRVTAWFIKGAEAFGATDLEKALAYLGESGSLAAVRVAFRELSGKSASVAR